MNTRENRKKRGGPLIQFVNLSTILTLSGIQLRADTIAYWRFEGTETAVPTSGAFVQDTDGRSAIQEEGIPVPDHSGNGNFLYTWNNDFSGHIHQPATEGAPYAMVPGTSEPNNWYIQNSGNYPASFTWSGQAPPSGINLDSWTSSTWTIEASFSTTTTNGYQTFVGREGNNVATVNTARAPLYFQVTPGGYVRILFVDATGASHIAQDSTPVVVNNWYSFAAVCDGTTLSLWSKAPGDVFREVASADVSTSADSSLVDPGLDANGDQWGWTVGRGRYGTSDIPSENHGDRFIGSIDEVRISDVNLTSSQFLAALPPSGTDSDSDGLPDSWERANFNGSLAEGPADDYDFDFATNLLEYQNRTDPDDPDSWPDTDGDLINDGYEIYYFPGLLPNSLAYGQDEDPDGDFNSNYEEFLSLSDPTDAFSYPDEDFDGMNDGWELHHFPEASSISDVSAESDADGDLYSNLDEFYFDCDPLDIFSSPDDENFIGDGLPDGWEVYYFANGSTDLETILAYQDGTDDPDGDGLSNQIEFAASTDPTDPLSGDPVLGYWQFEELTEGEVPAGGNGLYAFPTSIQDSSVYGNHMMAWADYSRPNYAALTPFPTIPSSGAPNLSSLYFERNNNGVYYVEAVFSTAAPYLDGGVSTLRSSSFDELTVEASFQTELNGIWQVPVAKFGNPVGGQPPFSLKIDPNDRLRLGLVDGSGTAREIIGTTEIAPGLWFSAAATVTETEMKLWLKKPDETTYTLEGTLAIEGTWFVPAEGPLETPWNIGAGMWNGTQTDAFQGYIDEVRISATVVPETEFLLYDTVSTSPYSNWALANIPDSSQQAPEDDPDGDGTPNSAEFLLGLDPMDASSYFAASLSHNELSWVTAEGLSFTIQRSTTLEPDDWEDLTTLVATEETESWSDPSPLNGTAFYRIVLKEN